MIEVRSQKSEVGSWKPEVRSQKSEARSQNNKEKIFFIICHLSSVICFLFSVCHAQSISSNELINNAREYDGKAVVYQGEVIGDVMDRGEFAWVNLQDGTNAIGIWSVKSLIKDIVYSGSYKSTGDIIEVEGVFHNRCLEHGGDLDIHAQIIRKIKSGRLIEHKVDIYKRNTAFSLLGALCLILILIQLQRRLIRK